MSSSATSNASSRTACSAALPSPTHTTWWPRPRRNAQRICARFSSSSATRMRMRLPPVGIGVRSCGARRQEDAKHAALADHAVHLDAAAVLGDDGVADRQPEPGAAARRLRREERLEDLRCDRRCGCRAPRSITSAIVISSSSSARVRSVMTPLSSIASSALSSSAMNTWTSCSSLAQHRRESLARLDADDHAPEARMMLHETQRLLDRRRSGRRAIFAVDFGRLKSSRPSMMPLQRCTSC